MYHSVGKVKKIAVLNLSFKLESSICLAICFHKVVIFTKSNDMLNKSTLGVKKVRGQSGKQAGATKSFDIS